MNKKISLGGALTLALMISIVTFVMTVIYVRNDFNSRVFNIKERETMYAKLAEVDRLVRQNYYNPIDEEALGENLVRGYVTGIADHYGMYLTAEQYAQTISSYDGKTVDIGVVCEQDPSGYILIKEVYENSPAQISGIMEGDLIVKVDDLAVSADTYGAAVDALRGEPGTVVSVLVRREGVETNYSITRRKVDVLTATGHMIDNIGYLAIHEFNDNTPAQFEQALIQLQQEGAEGLVFDVRGNPGGTIESVATILDVLLPEGPIVSATYKDGTTEVLYTSDAAQTNLPMAVLINSQTASAAELFAQALKDYNKARTVGSTTYGKGSMQKIYKLSDGSALDLTVARYNPPVSPNFEGVGVHPDYEVALSAELEKLVGTLDEQSDLQLKKALEVVAVGIRERASTGEPFVWPQVAQEAASQAPETAPPEESQSGLEEPGESESSGAVEEAPPAAALADSVYYIASSDGKYLNVYNGSDTNGAKIVLWDFDESKAQQFVLVTQGNIKKLYAMASSQGRVLDAMRTSGPVADGATAQLWADSDPQSQQLLITPQDDGTFLISLAGSPDLFLTATGSANNADVEFRTKSDSDSQKWNFELVQ